MPIITLLTDFGTDDEYVGVMKGVILSILPSAAIVDISHHIPPHDVEGAAWFILTYPVYFPPGTIHVAVVDPGVGTQRGIIAAAMRNQVFIAPDNGLLTRLLAKSVPDTLIRIEAPQYCLSPISRTFHGRDVFAPIAAHLASGIDLKKLGPRLAAQQVVRLSSAEPRLSENHEIVGRIVWVDRFGNLITNIEAGLLTKTGFEKNSQGLVIRLGNGRIRGISHRYADAGAGKPVALVGSRGCLEIAVNQGSARTYFAAASGDPIRINPADIRVKGA